ncbi:MAG: F0F1 ATP synthase subunit B [Pseudomonadota bacterium]
MTEMPFYQDPEFWISVSFALFVFLAFKPVKKMLENLLDERSALIASELAEAKRLRAEAEATLAAYKKKQEESMREADEIIASTNNEAEKILKQAEIDASLVLEKRMKLALDKISQAENKALQEVQNHIVDISVSVARSMIIEHLKIHGDADIVKRATTELERKLN